MVRKDGARHRFSNILNPEGDSDDGEDLTSTTTIDESPSDHTRSRSTSPSSFKSFSGLSAATKAKYKKLKNVFEDDGFTDLQFQRPEARVPWKAILLASILFIGGTLAITVSALIITGHLDKTPTDGPIILMVLGFLMFIPGSYHVRIAYYAFKEYPGYSFEDIPQFE